MRNFSTAFALSLTAFLSACAANDQAQTKVVSGEPVTAPQGFVASLTFAPADAPFCGASIVAHGVAMTAAHCVKGIDRKFYVTSGTNEVPAAANAAVVTRVVVHPQFDMNTTENDIALVWYDAGSLATLPVRLAEKPQFSTARIYGWGTMTSLGVVQPHQLNSAELVSVDRTQCEQSLKLKLKAGQLCAISAHGNGEDSCSGDSGGPLATAPAGEPVTQYGIVSFGHGCGQPGKPGVYTDVSHYVEWIRSLIAANPATDRAFAFESACYLPIQQTIDEGRTFDIHLRVTGSFATGAFSSKYQCPGFEVSEPDASGLAQVHDLATGLVAPAKIVERSFSWACGNFALMAMKVTATSVNGAISNSHEPHIIAGEYQHPDMNDLISDSKCALGASQAEIFVSARSGMRVVRFSGPAFPEIAGKLYFAERLSRSAAVNETPVEAKKVFLSSSDVDLVNHSDLVAHGLFLTCLKPFSVESGAHHLDSHKIEDVYAIGLFTPSEPWSTLPAHHGHLRLKLKGIDADGFIHHCKINNTGGN